MRSHRPVEPLFTTLAQPSDAAADGGAYGPTATSQLLDLVPVPAAIIVAGDEGFAFEAINRPFKEAGLEAAANDPMVLRELGRRLNQFVEGEERHLTFNWRYGSEVDSRHFRVMFARRAGICEGRRCFVTLVDQTSELRTEQSLRREMMTDSLTGLLNRTGFSEKLEGSIALADRAAFAVLAINLDRFSRVNACMGSLAGDELLISVARRMKGALRARDTLARTGGDEFAILLSLDDGPDDAMHVASRIEAALATPFRLSDFEIRVDCSIGIALGIDEDGDAEDLIRHAQFAVKRSKKTGRVETYQTRVFDLAREQFGIETDLRRAIENGSMTLSFQPICDLSSGRITSFEALARWTNEQGMVLSPSEFIPVAEESGLIVPLGRWAMAEAARTLKEWDRLAGGDCGARIAVNLSAIQIQRDRVVRMVQDVLETYQLDGKRFTIELTESAIVADPDRCAATMNELKALGARLAMDDFGTGYSNLAFLQRLPIDLLKIDRSFVSGMLADRDKVAIVRAILSLAQALGMATIAEGIETIELSQTLAALGCAYGQGFIFARPLPAAQAYQLLVERNA